MADRPMNRGRKARKKVCGFCVDKVENIDYKDIARLRRYVRKRKDSSSPCNRYLRKTSA